MEASKIDGSGKELAKVKGDEGITPTPHNSVSHFRTLLRNLHLESPASTAAAKDACAGHTSLPVRLEYYTYHIDSNVRSDTLLESLRNAPKEARQSTINETRWRIL